VPLVLVVYLSILLVVFFLSCALLFYSTGKTQLRKNITKGIGEHTTKTKGTNLKNFFLPVDELYVPAFLSTGVLSFLSLARYRF
jgi:hypothetical protein